MIYKILRKAHLGSTALGLLHPFIKNREELPAFDQAMQKLQELSPDPGTSCIREASTVGHGDFDLDVIIPAYNVEKYLKRCVDSVLDQQTDFSFRAIIIDDGSTDSTPQIADSYAGYSNVLVIHQENRGLSGARNSGYQQSSAEYVLFLDSDDYLCSDALDAMLRCASDNHAAIVEGAYNTVDTEGTLVSTVAHKQGCISPLIDLYGYAWGKLFRRELFAELRFPEKYWYEDSLMAQIVYPMVERRNLPVYGLSAAVCCYTVNPVGITGLSKMRPKSIDSLWITLQLFSDREKLGLEKDQKYYEYILNMLTLSYRRTQGQSEDVKKAMFVVWRDFILREFPDYVPASKTKNILRQAVHSGNYALYTAACKLI